MASSTARYLTASIGRKIFNLVWYAKRRRGVANPRNTRPTLKEVDAVQKQQQILNFASHTVGCGVQSL